MMHVLATLWIFHFVGQSHTAPAPEEQVPLLQNLVTAGDEVEKEILVGDRKLHGQFLHITGMISCLPQLTPGRFSSPLFIFSKKKKTINPL